jgi:hypothetical protein
MNAVMASRAAGSPSMRPKCAPSSSMRRSTASCCAPFISCLVVTRLASGLAASLRACCWAKVLHSVGGSTRLTRPTSSAASAMKGSPISSASAAR